jgi:hypothetical protein
MSRTYYRLAAINPIVSPMTQAINNRRTFLTSAAAVRAVSVSPLLAASTRLQAGADGFLKAWMTASATSTPLPETHQSVCFNK